jgi:hypothetical protein
MQQRMRLTTYEEHSTATSCMLERLMHENAVLRSGTLSPLEQDCELEVAYHHLGEAKHGWNNTQQLLDITREEVDIHTHEILHPEHTYETQGAKLEERTTMTTILEQQLLELQGQAPLEPLDHQEIDVMAGIDED